MPFTSDREEFPMANNKNPNEQQPGERKPGKHHYNPGNMSGKTADLFKEDGEKQNNLDTIESREPPPHKRENRRPLHSPGDER
jgi:hypothetical protein